LILNAVKHGDAAKGPVHIAMEKGEDQSVVRIVISNHGDWRLDAVGKQVGLQLAQTLLPRHSATLTRTSQNDQIVTVLELGPPVITLEQKRE
jgi:two-component sensor histidine kinase